MNLVGSQSLLEKAVAQFSNSLPFVLFNKPHAKTVVGIFQQDSQVHLVKDFTETGFVFASFDGHRNVLIPENKSEILIAAFDKSQLKPVANSVQPKDSFASDGFENLVKKAIHAIKNGDFIKVVLSRKEIVDVPDFKLKVVFETLLDEYSRAFTYCFFHPETGLWLGAFSEQLIKMKGNFFSTMAVAGTRPLPENPHLVWGEKEQEEQRLVTDFIVEQLKNKTLDIAVSSPYNLDAVKIQHIKTDISGTVHSNSGLREMIKVLHPTPAVCGFPKDAAKDFIIENEGYDREYYSGFLGELNKDFSDSSAGSDLYVNLRCMKIANGKASIYVGCGITLASIPEKEWIETVNKSQTMKRILQTN